MIDGHGQSHGDIVPEEVLEQLPRGGGDGGKVASQGECAEHPSHRTQSRIEEMQIGAVRMHKYGNVAIPIRQYPRQEPDAANLLVRNPWGGQPVRAVPTPTKSRSHIELRDRNHLILAMGRANDAIVWKQDAYFKDIEGVKYNEKKG